jgi:hypothetical protein
MATELDKLVVKIEADLSKLKKGMAEANKQVKSTSDRFKNSFGKINQRLDKAGATAIKVGAVIGTAIGVVAVKGFLDVGIQIENLQVRLTALFGSAQEGSKAFDEMVKFASKVPFTLQQIQQGSGSLAVVSKDSEELAKLLEITGNVASVTGIDFATASTQIQRSFAGGIASADVFREKGVRAMLGFEAGAEVSIEETRKRFEEVFGEGGKFGNASKELAKTLSGTLSMIGDKFFGFQKSVVDGFFTEFKQSMMSFNQSLEDNADTLRAFGTLVGESLAGAIRTIKNVLGEVGIALKIFTSLIVGAFAVGRVLALVSALKKLRTGMISLNVVTLLQSKSFKELGIRLLAGGVAYLGVEVAINKMNDAIEKTEKKLADQQDRFKAVSAVYDLNTGKLKENKEAQEELSEATKELIEQQEKINDVFLNGIDLRNKMEMEKAKEELDELMRPTEELIDIFDQAGKSISDAFGKAIASGESFRQSMLDIFQSVVAQVISLIVQLTIVEPLLKNIENAIRGASGEGQSLGGQILSGIGSIFSFGGGKAMGGNVNPNMPYMVGERGAEMFVPKTAGTIVPNNQLGGGITIEQNLNFATGVSQTVRAEVLNLLPAIKENTLSAVREARLRGGTFAKDFGA